MPNVNKQPEDCRGITVTEDEKIFKIYELFNARVLNLDRLLAERTNIFVIVSSILLGGATILPSTDAQLKIPLLVAGLILSIFAFSAINHTLFELRVLLGWCRTIESKEEAFESLKARDLTLHSAMDDWWFGRSKRFPDEGYHDIYMPSVPEKWNKLLLYEWLHPWNMYRAIPMIFFVIWIATLIWNVVSIVY